MSFISQTFSNSILDKMKKFYIDDMINPPPSGAIFRAKTDNAVITAYKSGKVLFQGKNPDSEAHIWTSFENDTNVNDLSLNQNNDYEQAYLSNSHIGSDESGTGDYFGPITTCAVYIKKEQIDQLKSIGIQDSKLITDQNIEKLSKQLINMNIPYSLMILHNEKYNILQKQGWSQGKMKAMLHHSTIKKLQEKLGFQTEAIVIDQFCMPNIYKKHLASEGESLLPHTHFLTKAEHHSIAVAAASVIARASFIKEMNRLSKESGYKLLKGASHKVDQLVAQIIEDKGEPYLNKIAKVHFANTNKAKHL